MTIFDYLTSVEIAAYWEELNQDREPYFAETLFPNDKKLGLDLKWIKGSKGLPAVLKNSGFDAAAVPRGRIGFESVQAEMPYFKESMYVNEELRQELNKAIEFGGQNYVDIILKRVFDDTTTLLEGAAAARERMRMMLLTTGVIAMESNGQTFLYDYGINHKGNATVDWSDHENADPIEDIRVAKETVKDETGEEMVRAVCDGKTWRDLRANKSIRDTIYHRTNGSTAVINDAQLRAFLLEEVNLEIYVDDKRYRDEAGVTRKYMPTDTFVMFPATTLGTTWFGTTPAESDLLTSNVANVSIVDTGVSVMTVKKHDPVNVETIVAQICLPSYEMADSVFILDTKVA